MHIIRAARPLSTRPDDVMTDRVVAGCLKATSMRAEWCNNEDKGKQRIGQLEADLAAAKAELEELRARYAPMARQQQAAREQVETLQDELAAVARRAEDKQAALSRADARVGGRGSRCASAARCGSHLLLCWPALSQIAELEKQARDGAAAMQRASAELDEACAQRSVAEHQLAAAHESAQAQAEELRRSHHVAGELTQRLAERGQEVSQLRADLETARCARALELLCTRGGVATMVQRAAGADVRRVQQGDDGRCTRARGRSGSVAAACRGAGARAPARIS